MKKYVSKEDVQKGLVDPKKPLTEQKEYLDKIQKQDREKHPHKDKQEHQGEQYKRKERQNKPKYNWRRNDVTQETPIPDAPKKQVPKPDKEKFFNQLNAYKKEIQQLNNKKSDLINDLKSTLRNTSQNKKNTQTVKTKYSHILRQKRDLKKQLQEELKILEQKKEDFDKQLNAIKDKIGGFKKPEHFEDCSTEELKRRLQKTQQRLTIEQLDKKQQNRINMKISQIKRAIQNSRSQVQINAEVKKLQDQNDFLWEQLKQIKSNINGKYKQLREVKDEIGKINQDLNNQKTEPEDTRTHEQIKADFDAKIENVNKQKTTIKQKIQKLRQTYGKSQDDYEDYSDLVSYIKMVKQQKQKIKSWKEEQQKRKKEKQQQQKKRQKQYEQRQKRKQQRQKRDQQRRKQNEQKKQKLQKDRQQFINRNPHHQQIQICKTLISYCQSLKPENAIKALQKRQEKVFQPMTDLAQSDNKDWEKQIKKGVQVIVSKKLKQDQEIPKKVVKEKKKKEKQVTENSSGFTHHSDTSNLFKKVNLLPPLTVTEIDGSIKQLNDRIQIFNKPSQQQVKAYKQKAQKQFDYYHGLSEDRGKKHNYKQKNGNPEDDHKEQQTQAAQTKEKEKPKTKKFEQKEAVTKQSQFPGLN